MRARVRSCSLLRLRSSLAACGSGSTSSQRQLSPVACVKHAALKTSQAPSEHIDADRRRAALGRQTGRRAQASGDFDNEQQLGDVAAARRTWAASTGRSKRSPMTANVYLKSALFQAMLPAGKTWLKIDVAKAAKTQGSTSPALLAQDPAQALQRLQARWRRHEGRRRTQVDGVPTTHYRDASPAAATMPGGSYDVWIGKDDGYVRRIDVSYGTRRAVDARRD